MKGRESGIEPFDLGLYSFREIVGRTIRYMTIGPASMTSIPGSAWVETTGLGQGELGRPAIPAYRVRPFQHHRLQPCGCEVEGCSQTIGAGSHHHRLCAFQAPLHKRAERANFRVWRAQTARMQASDVRGK